MEINDIALRIRAFRKLKGFTQSELAQAIGISSARLGAIERGTKSPTNLVIHQISQALQIDSKELNFPQIRNGE